MEPQLFDVASIEPHGIHAPIRTMYQPTIKKPCLGSPHLISYINLFPTMDSWTVVMMAVTLIFVPERGPSSLDSGLDRYIPMVVVSRLEVEWIPVRGKSILVLRHLRRPNLGSFVLLFPKNTAAPHSEKYGITHVSLGGSTIFLFFKFTIFG